ncbi:PhoX family phosphatase [Conexibacter sp. SYSU D00693]|uniref:PhoX family protein n=1 Tax=Conexibacter sp. SYSU D00693 TaxID=2812560 RepID=UPI00196B64C2|nr:alkaline phosphatase PhoX [Conexibacter sp. SYSU D00693]
MSTSRRAFIRGLAAAGASTYAAGALPGRGPAEHLFGSGLAEAAAAPGPFSAFQAIAPSSADALVVPEGFSARTLIRWGDEFRDARGRKLPFGFNNDFLAWFPLRGSREGLLFVNHEYPDPFFLHGRLKADTGPKTADAIAVEQESVGNSVLHLRRTSKGHYAIVDRSRYHRRITGNSPVCRFTGPLRGTKEVGTRALGSLANCSGGITPWGTALSCEENFQDYGVLADGGYGWGGEYVKDGVAKYGWVVETDPYDPGSTPRKHTALGRFRHENTAFRQKRGKPFVLYMGDDARNEGVYKFVSDRAFKRGDTRGNRKVLEAGTLYVARWEPEGRRRFAAKDDRTPVTATQGTGRWTKVEDEELVDTATRLRARLGKDEWEAHYATNRPEDLEIASDGRVFIALTNNSTVNDSHGAIRVLTESGGDPAALEFTWADYAAGGPTGRGAGEEGFSSCDNLVFDKAGNLWVLTDISSASLGKGEYAFHQNNAVFMVPTRGPNAGVAFRFASMPTEAEGTGPYFTPDERTFFMSVQHPGEETGTRAEARYGDPTTYTSWWPEGSRTEARNPATPRPSIVQVRRTA